MPTYEYICKDCGERLEVFQSFSAKPLKSHDGCGGPLQKVFHARGVVFKGSGFYVNDSRSRSGSQKNGTPKDGDSKKEKGSGSEKKDSKADSTAAVAAD